MDEKQKSIKTSSKVISIIMKIGYTAMAVGICLCIVGLIVLAVTGGQTSFLTSGGTRIVVIDAPNISTGGIVASIVAIIIACAFLFSIFYITYRMFHEIYTTCNPFNEKYVKSIKVIGILVVVMSIVCNFVDSIATTAAGVETLGIASDSPGIVFGVIIFCLSYIFDYGCTLQKQSDETL